MLIAHAWPSQVVTCMPYYTCKICINPFQMHSLQLHIMPACSKRIWSGLRTRSGPSGRPWTRTSASGRLPGSRCAPPLRPQVDYLGRNPTSITGCRYSAGACSVTRVGVMGTACVARRRTRRRLSGLSCWPRRTRRSGPLPLLRRPLLLPSLPQRRRPTVKPPKQAHQAGPGLLLRRCLLPPGSRRRRPRRRRRLIRPRRPARARPAPPRSSSSRTTSRPTGGGVQSRAPASPQLPSCVAGWRPLHAHMKPVLAENSGHLMCFQGVVWVTQGGVRQRQRGGR